MFVGFNVTFLPMHLTGLIGHAAARLHLSRAIGWDSLNLVSTVGAFMFAAGVLLFSWDRRAFPTRLGRRRARPATPGTPERWSGCRTMSMSTRSIPLRHEPRAAVGPAGPRARTSRPALTICRMRRPGGARPSSPRRSRPRRNTCCGCRAPAGRRSSPRSSPPHSFSC